MSPHRRLTNDHLVRTAVFSASAQSWMQILLSAISRCDSWAELKPITAFPKEFVSARCYNLVLATSFFAQLNLP